MTCTRCLRIVRSSTPRSRRTGAGARCTSPATTAPDVNHGCPVARSKLWFDGWMRTTTCGGAGTSQRQDVEPRVVAIENLRGALSARREVQRANHAHPHAVAIPVALEVVHLAPVLAPALHFEGRTLDHQRTESTCDGHS